MAARLSPIALAVTGALTLAACGGGGGSSTSATTTTPSSVDVTVTPSLGQFSTGCAVELRKSTGETLGSANVGSNGKATVSVTGYTGAVIATVKGSSTCTYFDEASGTDKPFGATQKLSAVVDSVRQELGVNILTNLAAARVLDTTGSALASGTTTDTIKQENATIQVMFQVGDIFAAPTLINSSTGKVLDNSEAGTLAAKLAALAEIANSKSTTVADLATNLADDLKDGTLDSVNTTALQTALSTAITKYADDTAKASLDSVASNTTLTTDTTAAKEQAKTALTAGTSLTQAKQIFADLRSSILSVSNSAGTGTLDKENALLKADFQNGLDVTKTFDNLTLMVNAVDKLYLGSDTSISNNTGTCSFTAPTSTEVVCLMRSPDTGKGYRVVLHPGSDGTSVNWQVTHVRDLATNVSTALTGLTGTMSRDSAGKSTLAGKFYPMTADGAYTTVDTSFTYTGSKGTQLWSGSGTLNTLKSDDITSTLKVAVTEFSADEAKVSAKLVGSLTGPHHRFDGTLEVSDLTTSLDGTAEPKTARFIGSFTDISTPATPFKFLEGTLTASEDQSAYNSTLPESATNFVKVTIGFAGTAYKSSGVAGIGFSLSLTNSDGYDSPKGEFTLTGLNGLSLTAKATPVSGGFNWEIKNSNGITVTYVAGAKTGTIKNADGTSLGTISDQRVSFIDGTFESLI